MFTVKTDQLPIKIWSQGPETVDPACLEQARHVAALPSAAFWVALMPDAHVGFGMPIGGVVATREIVVPNAVGVDIGCGMRYVQTDLRVERVKAERRSLVDAITRRIPLGFDKRDQPLQLTDSKFPNVGGNHPALDEEWRQAAYQLGTLGGGNHFIEVQQDDEGFVGFMVHSGSRHFGYTVARYFDQLAVEKCKSGTHEKWQLAYLELGDPTAGEYIGWMQRAMAFAKANRAHMMDEILSAAASLYGSFQREEAIDVHHNYVAKEEHFGTSLWVHRKGALRAEKDETAIIPGAMGRPSYLVRGLGAEESFCSASHGAGRLMSRKQAKKQLKHVALEKMLLERDLLLATPDRRGVLDEAPEAYKPIDDVLEEEKDLVEPIKRLQAIAVIKG
jgi:tRNA-splicing ligase RtcB